jgi:phosphoribosyl-ATP pyrophosphohydrolase
MVRNAEDALARLAAVIESRKAANGGDPEKSYVARLLHKGPDAFLKKIGEEATEVVMAAKDADHGGDPNKVIYEVADLWFHSMIALAHYGLTPAQVVAELERREGTSGIEEKALRKAQAREAAGMNDSKLDSLRTVSWVSYLLHLIVAVAAVLPGAQVGAGLLLVALIIDLVKKSDALGSWQESHFRWRIRSVLWAGLLYVLTAPLFLLLYLPGALAWALISLWFLYRIVRGMVAMNKDQAVGHG